MAREEEETMGPFDAKGQVLVTQVELRELWRHMIGNPGALWRPVRDGFQQQLC